MKKLGNRHSSIFTSAILGNILEYYDFTVYSVFAVIIGRTFFPMNSEFSQILLSLAVFAVGFVARPIGGLIFGHIGDKYGRKKALILSMLGITIPTFAIGVIPSFSEIGVYAPILLIIMRLIQGLCISGEGVGTAIFILEHHQHLKPGFTAGIVHGSNIAGTLIAAFVGIVVSEYFGHITFAWRFAFLLGGLIGFLGLYLRLYVSETPVFKMLANQRKTLNTSLLHLLKTAKRPMLLTFCIGGVASSTLYLVKTYVNIFYTSVMHFENSLSLIYMSYASIIAMLSMPLFGLLADLFGRCKVLILVIISIIILIWPALIFMAAGQFWLQILALTMLGTLGGAISGCAYIFIINLFKPEEKFLGTGFSYNLGIALFGGTSPVISRWLIETTNLSYAPAFYITALAVIFLCVFFFFQLSNKISI